jgi:hypothetical protein
MFADVLGGTGKTQVCKATKFRALEDGLSTNRDWVDWKTFTSKYTGNAAFFEHPVIATEVSEVPCKAKGCCNLLVHLRPNTTVSILCIVH